MLFDVGLSISFDLARKLGGRIEAANREGGGACLSLYLPPAEGTTAPVSKTSAT
jgi:signal transduction histidine kinase